MRPGSTQRTVAGVLEVVRVEEVDLAAITEDDALAGVASLDRLHRLLNRRAGARVFRMEVRPPAPIPGWPCASSRSCPTPTGGPSTSGSTAGTPHGSLLDPRGAAADRRAARRPGARPRRLAGPGDLAFKRDVRKLKELGLTRSLEVGYEISPRGRAYLG